MLCHLIREKYKYQGSGLLCIPLYEHSDAYKYVMDITEKEHLYPRLFQDVQYTKSELDKIRYFQMGIPDVLEYEGKDTKDYGTKFVDSCKVCVIGGKPVSDAMVDRKFLKKYKIGSLRPCIFVKRELRDIILKTELTGVSFNYKVRDYKNRPLQDDYYVMEIDNILPPMKNTTWLVDNLPDCRPRECGITLLICNLIFSMINLY